MESGRAEAQLLVDLINTRYLGDQHDVLADAGTEQWMREHLGNQHRSYAPAALTPLRQLREGLRELALGNNGGEPDAERVATAEMALRAAPMVVSLGEGARLCSTARDGSVEQQVAMIGAALLSSQIAGAWRRVKVCAEPNCGWAFLDRSRNGSRRWCDMSECGNRAKNRAWRARQTEQ